MKGDPTATQRITLNWSEDDEEGVRNLLRIRLHGFQSALRLKHFESTHLNQLFLSGDPVEKHYFRV